MDTNEVMVGLVSPGAMGASVGAAACANAQVLWASEGRSAASRTRALRAGLEDAGTMRALVDRAEVLLSVCPPGEALEVARSVRALGFSGLYVDANAVAPATSRRIAQTVTPQAQYVDGGIIGPPADGEGTTRLYLVGADAQRVVALFAGTPLRTIVVEGHLAAASALKMCYAAYTKGVAALLLAVRSLAHVEGVDDVLVDEWTMSIPHLRDRTEELAARNAPKAWRFEGEMLQIAQAFSDVGLPAGFHRAAADVYDRMSSFKDASGDVTLDKVVSSLLASDPSPASGTN